MSHKGSEGTSIHTGILIQDTSRWELRSGLLGGTPEDTKTRDTETRDTETKGTETRDGSGLGRLVSPSRGVVYRLGGLRSEDPGT